MEAATIYTPATTSSRQFQSKAVVPEMGRKNTGRCGSIVRDRSLREKIGSIISSFLIFTVHIT